MKIVQYMLGFRNADGGVVRALIDLCNMLAARGHEVIVLTTDASDAPRDWDGKPGRPLLRTLGFHRIGEGVLTRTAKRTARQWFNGADVVHLHVPWDLICVQLGRMARGMRIPYIMTVHGMLDDWTMRGKSRKKRLYLTLGGRAMLERAALVQCCAQVEMEQSQKWYPRGRSIVVPLPFDLSPFEQMPGPEMARTGKLAGARSNQPLLLTMGRLHPIKRTELVIESVAALKRQGVAVQLALAGNGEAACEQSLRDLASRLGVHDQVHFVGFVTGAEKLSLYQAADVLVHPSAHESFGLGMIEAIAAGTPVLTTKAVNIWPELEAGGGAVITGGDVVSLAAGIRDMIADPQRTKAMGRAGREWVFKFLEPNHLLAQYENMYRRAIGHG